MNNYVYILISFLSLNFSSFLRAEDTVIHPVPKEPIYLNSNWYDTLKSKLPPPPKKNSPEQKRDESILQKHQATRSPADCERAKTEIFVSLKNFFGKPNGPLDDKVSEKLAPFFEQLRNDGDYFVQLLKKDFPRERPFLYIAMIEPCVGKEVTGAYPSGHAVLAKLYELVLADFFPKEKAALTKRGKQIGDDRVLSGMHHPSDVESGRRIGELIYEELKKSKKYLSDFEENRKKL
jgi:acid phosphatase (class A)